MRRILFTLAFVLSASASAWAQTATVTHNVNLRLDASTEQEPIRLLMVGEHLTLVDANKDDGYYHVETADNEEGFVWGNYIRVEAATVQPLSVTAPSGFDPSWPKPAPNMTQFTNASGVTCGPFGDSDEHETNQRKNRTDLPQAVHDVTFMALAMLPYPKAPKERSQWSAMQLAVIEPFEGVGVRVVGYLAALKPQTGGSGESTNCHMTKAAEVDWHMALVEKAGGGEDEGVVIETTPRVRRNHPNWTKTRLTPWVDSTKPVRITGWTFLDPEHRNHLNKYRVTLWEVHPITKLEVKQGTQWVDLDNVP
jgi:uncharacterized protein YgiM (DUF1202 family)